MASVSPRAALPGAAERVCQADDPRMCSELLTRLNHEIRTPLSGILGMADLLLETGLDGDQKEYAGAIRLCAEELLERLNAALELAAIASGHAALEESDFNLHETLQGVAAEHREKAEAKGLELALGLDGALPKVVAGDAVRLRETVSRVLGIAMNVTPDGRIEIQARGTRAAGGRLDLEVTVRCAGMPSGICLQACRPHKAEPYPTLGLMLAGAEAKLMGGELRAERSAVVISVPLRAVGAV